MERGSEFDQLPAMSAPLRTLPCLHCTSRQHESARCPTQRCTACGAFGCNAALCRGQRAYIRRIGMR